MGCWYVHTQLSFLQNCQGCRHGHLLFDCWTSVQMRHVRRSVHERRMATTIQAGLTVEPAACLQLILCWCATIEQDVRADHSKWNPNVGFCIGNEERSPQRVVFGIEAVCPKLVRIDQTVGHSVCHPYSLMNQYDPCFASLLISPRHRPRYNRDAGDCFVVVTVQEDIAFSSRVLRDDKVPPKNTGVCMSVQLIGPWVDWTHILQ